MLALIYIAVAIFLGDIISKRFLSYASVAHRLATSVLTGLLLSTCITYLAALLFAQTSQPLLWANILFFALAVAVIFVLQRTKRFRFRSPEMTGRPPGNWKYDAAFLAVCMLIGTWLMLATLDFRDGGFTFAIKSWSDFGANLSLAQSFAVGNNYPSQHPFYPGEPVRYHFLFWFLSANLSYLGLNLVWAINALSLLSLLALLVLLMTFAEALFNSRAVGRISALLFFFSSSSLSYLPFLKAQESFTGAISAIFSQRDFLKSGYPYRGDDWGALSVTVFANQRQLISAIGIVLIVLIHLIGFYRKKGAINVPETAAAENAGIDETENSEVTTLETESVDTDSDRGRHLPAMIFCGVLIGALPYWNSAVFVAASLILGGLFVLFRKRLYIAAMIATVVVTGLPQIFLLRSGKIAPSSHSLFHWGYLVNDPTILKVLEYVIWTFGFKLVLIGVAVYLVPWAYRRFLLALCIPAFVVFLFQLSTDVFNNHKLLNIWSVLVSVYVAYALWSIGKENILRGVLAAMLAIAMTFGAFVDLFPVRNDGAVTVPYHDDRLTTWLFENTASSDIFLTDPLLAHPILFTGRKVYLGNTLFAWTAGYDLAERERTHRRMFMTQDLNELKNMLHESNIAFVAIDDAVRTNSQIKGLNENLFDKSFEKVFEDPERKYGNLKIYRVSN